LFIPLYDGVEMRHIRRPYGVYLLLAANIAVFLVTATQPEPGRMEFVLGMIPAVVFGNAMVDPAIAVAPGALTPFTSLFLHGDIWHLAGNMLFLWVFGDNVEDAMGSVRFVVFYLVCGALAALAHAIMTTNPEAPLIGASGAVSGLVAAYLLLHPHVRIFGLVLKWLPIAIPALYVIAAWIAFQFASALLEDVSEVAWWAHVGGILAGAALIPLFKRREVLLFDRRRS
jgi:membrane associated rhomboid family serine protease